ncbi:MAG: lytic transglycosylase domain-containing protein [Clostridiales bacterium]|jgi:soluble lytic murein transglycosylase|nr:lytic transglycosylase domain-containing protein [Clostridiales bacterium]
MKITKIAIILLFLALVYFWGVYAIRTVYPLKYYALISEAAQKYGLELSFVCGLIHTESRFDANAVSGKNASGLMQLTKSTADWGASEIGIENYSYDNILTPDINIELGCWYISKLINQYGDESVALAAYNGGSGNVDRWLADKKTSSDGKTLQSVPFKETQTFIERVGKSEKIYNYLLKFKNYIY